MAHAWGFSGKLKPDWHTQILFTLVYCTTCTVAKLRKETHKCQLALSLFNNLEHNQECPHTISISMHIILLHSCLHCCYKACFREVLGALAFQLSRTRTQVSSDASILHTEAKEMQKQHLCTLNAPWNFIQKSCHPVVWNRSSKGELEIVLQFILCEGWPSCCNMNLSLWRQLWPEWGWGRLWRGS